MEDHRASLASFRQQLTQVEVALAGDPKNAELHKLKKDLEECIRITQDLVGEEVPEPSGDARGRVVTGSSGLSWRVGDHCQAVWSADGLYYEAVIDAFDGPGITCTVTYEGFGNTETNVNVASLRPSVAHPTNTPAAPAAPAPAPANSKKRTADAAALLLETDEARAKRLAREEKEAKKQKAIKKKERFEAKQSEQAAVANKWQQFASKEVKGKVKKSIFASPDNPNGRVGVGTCGIGGKPPTDLQKSRDNWRQALNPSSFGGAAEPR